MGLATTIAIVPPSPRRTTSRVCPGAPRRVARPLHLAFTNAQYNLIQQINNTYWSGVNALPTEDPDDPISEFSDSDSDDMDVDVDA